MSENVERAIFEEIAATCPAMRSRALSRSIARRFDQALRGHGVNSSQFAILVAVGVSESCRVNALADTLELSRAAATRSLDILERDGLLVSTTRTGRAREVSLTPAGRDLVKGAYPDWRALRDAIADSAERVTEAIPPPGCQ